MGKIFGTKKDYWIVCGTLNHVEEQSSDKNVEPRGTGVNADVYWVTDNVLADWIQLPECKPEYIAFARLIKHVMSGDLNASIESNPPFPGKERHFLRAQLARIFAATQIAPKGLYEIDEETNKVKMSEEFALPSTDELKTLEAWGNTQASILKVGRTSHHAPEGLEDEAKEAYLAEQEASGDTPAERFRALVEHTAMPGMETAWLSKVVGDQQQYNQTGGKEGTTSYSVNVIKSLRWPGATTVQKGGKFCNIYLGWGLKTGDANMFPIEPADVQRDPEDPTEMPEPTPLQEPPAVVENDTEDKDEEDDQ